VVSKLDLAADIPIKATTKSKPQKLFIMKTKQIKFLLLLSAVFIIACSDTDSDSNDPNDNTLRINIDEYPRSGDIVTQLSSTLEGTINYNIISQTISDAFIIINDAVTVGDWLQFDFEMRDMLFATIESTNGTETQTIELEVTINNVDDIKAFLNNSRASYENADQGDWVHIEESEYNDLANYLAQTSKSGATDSQIISGGTIESHSGDRTIANHNNVTIPEGSYLFAFKYYSWINNVVSNRVKLSLDDASGQYQYVGNVLPEHDDEYNHFVLKGVNETTSSEGFIGMYSAGRVGVRNESDHSYKWRNGDVDNLDNTANGIVYLYQGLSTTLKQWD
jgi:hypothetical protein